MREELFSLNGLPLMCYKQGVNPIPQKLAQQISINDKYFPYTVQCLPIGLYGLHSARPFVPDDAPLRFGAKVWAIAVGAANEWLPNKCPRLPRYCSVPDWTNVVLLYVLGLVIVPRGTGVTYNAS